MYGEGEYVSASEADVSGAATYQLVTASGQSKYKALERKQIRGWLAVILTAHDRTSPARACPPEEQITERTQTLVGEPAARAALAHFENEVSLTR
jgi:hypothetical protein